MCDARPAPARRRSPRSGEGTRRRRRLAAAAGPPAAAPAVLAQTSAGAGRASAVMHGTHGVDKVDRFDGLYQSTSYSDAC